MTASSSGASAAPPPYPCKGWTHEAEAPESYEWRWVLAHGGWRFGGDGKRCRFTIGPGHTTCKRPAVATLLRGGAGRYRYCERHLYGRVVHDGAVWSPFLAPVASADSEQSS